MNLKAILFGIVAALGLEMGGSVFAQSTNPANPHDFSAFQIVSERNIFDPNRQPRVRTPRTTPRPPKIVDSFSLVGTMSYSNVLLAFFDGTSSDYRKSLAPGGKIANYTAAEVGQDVVKLVSGTNEIELKVGMQMRRSADGKWAAAAASETSLASNNRNEERGNRRFDRNNSNPPAGNSGSEPMGLPGPESEPDQPPNLSNLDPNDPVARLMLAPLTFHWYLMVTGAGPQVPTDAESLTPTLAVPVIFGVGATRVPGATSTDARLVLAAEA